VEETAGAMVSWADSFWKGNRLPDYLLGEHLADIVRSFWIRSVSRGLEGLWRGDAAGGTASVISRDTKVEGFRQCQACWASRSSSLAGC
jgi:hypothetical protein